MLGSDGDDDGISIDLLDEKEEVGDVCGFVYGRIVWMTTG